MALEAQQDFFAAQDSFSALLFSLSQQLPPPLPQADFEFDPFPQHDFLTTTSAGAGLDLEQQEVLADV
jgi:hypothetical protein